MVESPGQTRVYAAASTLLLHALVLGIFFYSVVALPPTITSPTLFELPYIVTGGVSVTTGRASVTAGVAASAPAGSAAAVTARETTAASPVLTSELTPTVPIGAAVEPGSPTLNPAAVAASPAAGEVAGAGTGPAGGATSSGGGADSNALYTAGPGSLELPGWTWEQAPQINDYSSETGFLRFRIRIDATGEVQAVTKLEGNVSTAVERLYRDELLKTTFARTQAGQQGATGVVTFRLQAR